MFMHQFRKETTSRAEGGGGDGCHGYRFWLSLYFSLPLFLRVFFFFFCLSPSLRLLVLSVGVGIDGLVYELNPVGLSCRKSEPGDREGFTWARAVSYWWTVGHPVHLSRSRVPHKKHHNSILGAKGLIDMFPLSNVIIHSGLCEVSLWLRPVSW